MTAYYHIIGRPTGSAAIDEDWEQAEGAKFFCRNCGNRRCFDGPVNVQVVSQRIKGRLIIFGSPTVGFVEHNFIKELIPNPERFLWFGEVLTRSGKSIAGYSAYASRLRVVPIRARAPLETEPCPGCNRIVFTGYSGLNRYVVAPHGLRHEIYESNEGGLLLREDLFKKGEKNLKGLRIEKLSVESLGFDGVNVQELDYEDQELPQEPNETAERLETVALPQEPEVADSSVRYTGENPPENVLLKFPNWIQALDEEGVEGQDETTMKPDENQKVISVGTQHTAADVSIYSGKNCAALLSLEKGRVESVTVYDGMWSVKIEGDKWQPEKWAHDTRYHGNTTDFPITVKSRLPYVRTRCPIEFQLFPDGSIKKK